MIFLNRELEQLQKQASRIEIQNSTHGFYNSKLQTIRFPLPTLALFKFERFTNINYLFDAGTFSEFWIDRGARKIQFEACKPLFILLYYETFQTIFSQTSFPNIGGKPIQKKIKINHRSINYNIWRGFEFQLKHILSYNQY